MMMHAVFLTIFLLPPAQPQGGERIPLPARASPREILLHIMGALAPVDQDQLPERLFRTVDALLAHTDPSLAPELIAGHRRNVLFGLGVLFDPGDALLKSPGMRPLLSLVIRREEKRTRAGFCARLYIRGRHDATQHFFISAALTAVVGPFLAERIGWHKELADARRFDSSSPSGDGFSFLDLAYNIAGIRYACWLLGWNEPGRLLRAPPPLAAFFPDFRLLDLPEKLGWREFQRRYPSRNHPAFRDLLNSIHRTVDASLSPYQQKESSGLKKPPQRQ